MVNSMDRPNITVPLGCEGDAPAAKFPLLRISKRDEDTGQEVGVFFHPIHGDNWWDWNDRAPICPTWMDPHLFVEMCLKDERVKKILRGCFKRNSEIQAKRELPAILDELFEEVYLVEALERFETARDFLREWLVRHFCYKATDPAKKRRKKKKKKRRRVQE